MGGPKGCKTMGTHRRPKSADLGGLHLATGSEDQGHGWLGDGIDLQTPFAELLSDMYNESVLTLNEPEDDLTAWADIPRCARERFICSLDSWNFEPHRLTDTEVLQCCMLLFEGLYSMDGMAEVVGVPLDQLYPFIRHLRRIYRLENCYHNFRHALDVLQASYSFLRSAGVVPSLSILFQSNRRWRTDRTGSLVASLDLSDIFLIYVAAIGHDVGHPGFTNVFMKNAQTPLSVVFSNRSALEQMHCSLLLRIMRHHGLGRLLLRPDARKLLWETVMATDMSVHADFMARFQSMLSGEEMPTHLRKILVAQAIMKCADISNPCRPYHVSQHWATRLMKEWHCQASFEKQLSLPTTVQSSEDALSEAKGQLFFNATFARPLFELTIKAIPDMQMYGTQCISNFLRWQERKANLEKSKPVLRDYSVVVDSNGDFGNAFRLTLPADYCGSDVASSGSDSDEGESVASSTLAPSTVGSDATLAREERHAAIRGAAGKALRKQKSIANRNSWSPMGVLAVPALPSHNKDPTL
ncbi:HD-domain/PDEase-like protein [Cylindrobasidium torrendii FP15055 ss-10]|uniref:Phosphodiesterase n=1 Tax=Cylindrobasidium torrendii FP15055 ss-10 TaxID=1314674 RepID=A0A0D7BE76_9AGAR|nr:HD-domain/PDEase-like protein [Cylindrobasidium torrendii FP15055 ss-10]